MTIVLNGGQIISIISLFIVAARYFYRGWHICFVHGSVPRAAPELPVGLGIGTIEVKDLAGGEVIDALGLDGGHGDQLLQVPT